MHFDTKSILHEAVRQYISTDAPEQMEEFDVVFDDVYQAVCELSDAKHEGDVPEQEEGLPFDAGIAVGTVITTACWIGMCLLVAITKYASKRGFRHVLDSAEKRLHERGASQRTLQRMRTIIEGIVEEL